jgi:hypothetical protein
LPILQGGVEQSAARRNHRADTGGQSSRVTAPPVTCAITIRIFGCGTFWPSSQVPTALDRTPKRTDSLSIDRPAASRHWRNLRGRRVYLSRRTEGAMPRGRPPKPTRLHLIAGTFAAIATAEDRTRRGRRPRAN